jgi:hypothetical protein
LSDEEVELARKIHQALCRAELVLAPIA